MIKVNLADAKSRLSQYLDRVERGETVILCRRNVPVAEIRPLPRALTEPRPVGTDPDLAIPDSFFDPLPEALLDAFEGGASSHRTEPATGTGGGVFEQLERQWTEELRTFYNQKHRPSRPEDLSKLSDIIEYVQVGRLRAPRPLDQALLVAKAEELLLAADGGGAG